MPHLVTAPDKFRGTATGRDVAAAVARAAEACGWTCDEAPVSDGGEGLLDALGGPNRQTRVRGPLGEVVVAEWHQRGDTAVIEMARAAGLELAGGPEWNDPLRASTAGVGELIRAAVQHGAKRVIVGAGGSATTDGGQACLDALEPHGRLAGVELLVACDVDLPFLEAAEVFAPQKGASARQVELLTRRLVRLAQVYEETYGIDVRDLPGAGAAGGLAGGLAAIGAELVRGIDLVAETIELPDRLEGAALCVTGEGFLDDQSFAGKAVGGVVSLARSQDVPVLIIAGEAFGDQPAPYVSLVERYGRERAMSDPLGCIEDVVRTHLTSQT